jgi:hypothetical protein
MSATASPASPSSHSALIDPFLFGSEAGFEESSNLEVLMGVFNSDSIPLSLKEAILFATTHAVLSDAQLQS